MPTSRTASSALSDLSDPPEMERASSADSDVSGWALDTQMSVYSEEELNQDDLSRSRSLNATERWKKNTKMIQKGMAFSRAFRTLRDMGSQNTIDPARLKHVRVVGEGAFATVELCLLDNLSPNCPLAEVAVKRLKLASFRKRQDLQRFFQEGAMLRKIQHRYIAEYIGQGNFSPLVVEEVASMTAKEAQSMLHSTFIVQEFINGGSLKDMVLSQMLMTGGRAYSDTQACEWLLQVAEGLDYIHCADPQIIHRDLKLENVLLRDVGEGRKEACLVDFGMSVYVPVKRHSQIRSSRRKLLGPKVPWGEGVPDWLELKESVDEIATALDDKILFGRTDTAMAEYRDPEMKSFDLTGKTGSFMYMAPEVFDSEAYNEKADVFSFACIMSELFSRFILSTQVVGPTGNPNAAMVYAEKVARGYRHSLPKGLPQVLKDLIEDCWAQEPHERPTMGEALERLAAIYGSGVLQASDAAAEAKAKSRCCCIM